MNGGSEAWRELSERELKALVPFTIHCRDLDAAAVRQVRRTWKEMVVRSFLAFIRELERVPDEREAELLARAVIAHINAVTSPAWGGAGGAHATIQCVAAPGKRAC
jgi:hypothetical protein